MKVKLNNSTELETVGVNGQSKFLSGQVTVNGLTRYFQGANRDVLDIQFATDSVTFESLDALFGTSENVKKLYLEGPVYDAEGNPVLDDTGNQVTELYLYENYIIRVSIGKIVVQITPATGTQPAVMEERYSVIMAQMTYAEMQQEEAETEVTDLQLALTEVYELVLGGM